MSKVPIRMKNKMLSKVHLDSSGNMVISAVKAASDLASKGISAQPAGPMTEAENAGNPNPPPSQSTSLAGTEPSTGAPAERVAPETMPEADKQPAMKDLEQSPSQDSLPVAEATEDAPQPTAGTTAPAPHELHPGATAPNVLKTETAADATISKAGEDASATMHPTATQAAFNE